MICTTPFASNPRYRLDADIVHFGRQSSLYAGEGGGMSGTCGGGGVNTVLHMHNMVIPEYELIFVLHVDRPSMTTSGFVTRVAGYPVNGFLSHGTDS